MKRMRRSGEINWADLSSLMTILISGVVGGLEGAIVAKEGNAGLAMKILCIFAGLVVGFGLGFGLGCLSNMLSYKILNLDSKKLPLRVLFTLLYLFVPMLFMFGTPLLIVPAVELTLKVVGL